MSSTTCATPQEGCPCAIGGSADCAVEIKQDPDFVWCQSGTRTCTAGSWSACVTNGETAIHSKSLPLSLSNGAFVHTLALGTQMTCASSGLDLCDPYCQSTDDTAPGLDAGGGFSLSDGGLVVSAGCGNGVIDVPEECDDGNTMSGDGCSSGCILETGFQCLTPGMPCTVTTCGNNIREGAEQCDDGNLRPYDGCSPTCFKEASCTSMGCAAICGDGLKFPTEACDDGNTTNGDGCSSTCTIEMGATCTTVTASLPPTITVPVIFRDFTPMTNPDFEFPFSGPGSLATGVIPGVTQNMLAADQEPAFQTTHGTVTSATTFNQWYHDGPANLVVLGSLTLTKQPDNSYLYNSQLGAMDPYVSFFPIDGLGFGNFAMTGHNYSFTSELRYPFTYQGGEVLDFLGDDDLWVFINGRLAVDLGGAHGPSPGSVTLNAATAGMFGLTVGNTYRLDVFQAERHSTGSSYKLTLRGFVQQRSFCSLPSTTTYVRDFQAMCNSGERPVWQLFRWKAAVPPLTSIDFRAATADTLAALPAAPPAAAPTTVPIGSATPVNSPLAGPVVFTNDVDAMMNPVTVATHLKVEGANTPSKSFLRVYMTFNALGVSPRLDEWQQLYDCIPME
jgi:fibro-slime domain-containing protein